MARPCTAISPAGSRHFPSPAACSASRCSPISPPFTCAWTVADSAELSGDFRLRGLVSGLALGTDRGAGVLHLDPRRAGDAPSAHELVGAAAGRMDECLRDCGAGRLVVPPLPPCARGGDRAGGADPRGLGSFPISPSHHPGRDASRSAAPAITLRLLLVALGLGALILFPSLYYLFHVFKQPGR